MDRWAGIFKVPLDSNSSNYYRVAASIALSSSSKTLPVPSANAIFFNGDRVQGTGNPVIERLSDPQRIAQVLVSKLGASVNAWVVEASLFAGPFAVYRDFVHSVNRFGEPKLYSPAGFPASSAIVTLLSNCLEQAKNAVSGSQNSSQAKNVIPGSENDGSTGVPVAHCHQLKTFVLGFSKGGVVLNQLVTELSSLAEKSVEQPTVGDIAINREDVDIIPTTKEDFLNSITEIHYVDVGLNSCGAYIADRNVIEGISRRLRQLPGAVRFVLHGTPRQWRDRQRRWILSEKDELVRLLRSEAEKSGGKLEVCERFYFADRPPDMQMHFEIIEKMDVS